MADASQELVSVGDVLKGRQGKEWKVLKLIGSGTCCQVYCVRLMGEELEAALKVYRQGPQFHAACHRESMLLELTQTVRQNCPQLVRILDEFEHNSYSCLVEELLESDIRQMIYKNQGQGLSLYLIQKLATDLLSGTCDLHQVGFVHGDLKPANMLWSPHSARLKIIDFSLSFHWDDKDVWKLQSMGYRAPEVEKWNERRDTNDGQVKVMKPCPASDMWSIGCIIAEMFLGKKLSSFTKDIESQDIPEDVSMMQMLVSHIVKKRDDDKDEDALDSLRELIIGCLFDNPNDRVSAENALRHPFFLLNLEPSFVDLLLLPSRILRFVNVLEAVKMDDEKESQGIIEDVLDECKKHGPIRTHIVPKEGQGQGKMYVEFEMTRHSAAAYETLSKQTFNDHSVLITYFCDGDFSKQNYF